MALTEFAQRVATCAVLDWQLAGMDTVTPTGAFFENYMPLRAAEAQALQLRLGSRQTMLCDLGATRDGSTVLSALRRMRHTLSEQARNIMISREGQRFAESASDGFMDLLYAVLAERIVPMPGIRDCFWGFIARLDRQAASAV